MRKRTAIQAAFKHTHKQRSVEPDPDGGSEPRELPAVDLALRLLAKIAEDPLITGSYRVAARRHLHRLRAAAEAEPVHC